MTSASVHDSQVAIPLATFTAQKIVCLYDLMDAAYDVPVIIEHSKSLGHVPLIDKNPRLDALQRLTRILMPTTCTFSRVFLIKLQN